MSLKSSHIVNLELIVELFTVSKFDLNRNVLEMLSFMRIFVSCIDKMEYFYDCNKDFIGKLYTCYQKICKFFWQGWVFFRSKWFCFCLLTGFCILVPDTISQVERLASWVNAAWEVRFKARNLSNKLTWSTCH